MRVSTLSATAAVLVLVPGPAAALWPFDSIVSAGGHPEAPPTTVAARSLAAPAGAKMGKREWYCYWFGDNCPSDGSSGTTEAVASTGDSASVQPEEWTQIDAVKSEAVATTNPWTGFKSFDWTPWTGWSFWGYTLSYVEGWYYDNYGLKPAPGVADWAHLSAIVSYYGTPPSKQTATPSISAYTHGGAVPFATAHATTTTHAATSASTASGSAKASTSRTPSAEESAFYAASAKAASQTASPQVSTNADYTSLATHAASSASASASASGSAYSRKPSKEEEAFYSTSAQAAKGTAAMAVAAVVEPTQATGASSLVSEVSSIDDVVKGFLQNVPNSPQKRRARF